MQPLKDGITHPLCTADWLAFEANNYSVALVMLADITRHLLTKITDKVKRLILANNQGPWTVGHGPGLFEPFCVRFGCLFWGGTDVKSKNFKLGSWNFTSYKQMDSIGPNWQIRSDSRDTVAVFDYFFALLIQFLWQQVVFHPYILSLLYQFLGYFVR